MKNINASDDTASAVLLSTNVHCICKVKTYKSCDSQAEMEGKNFLITGAANGIGLAVTRVVLGAGARVVMADVDREAGQQRQQELRGQFGQRAALFLELDVREEESWRQVTTSRPVTATER